MRILKDDRYCCFEVNLCGKKIRVGARPQVFAVVCVCVYVPLVSLSSDLFCVSISVSYDSIIKLESSKKTHPFQLLTRDISKKPAAYCCPCNETRLNAMFMWKMSKKKRGKRYNFW